MLPSDLQALEDESIEIIREAAAVCERPVMLYSIGKDSGVMLHLAKRAFYPARLPFPLLHVDTTWKFRDMISFREQIAKTGDFDLLVHRNPDALREGINPFDHGSALHTDRWKTEGLRQALALHRFDAAFGGARRDEEASRAKERIFSLRSENQGWDPKQQRPEPWRQYNLQKRAGESLRIFPLSNWTERDVWRYTAERNLPVVPLYFAAPRPVVLRDGQWIMVDDGRFRLKPGEQVQTRTVRFRSLGCYPLSAAVESTASTLVEIIEELDRSAFSERQGRAIDRDSAFSMEKKKREGYF